MVEGGEEKVVIQERWRNRTWRKRTRRKRWERTVLGVRGGRGGAWRKRYLEEERWKERHVEENVE